MAFLGDAAEDDAARQLAAIPSTGPITLRLVGGGQFVSAVWAGVSGDVGKLAALRDAFRGDERPFRPHLTLSYRFDRAILDALDGYAGPSWVATECSLVRSTAGEYQTVSSVRL